MRTIDRRWATPQNRSMSRYAALLGRWVEVRYRSGEMLLPATGRLSADSAKSIFLESSFGQEDGLKTFRWEIPYKAIIQLEESRAPQTQAVGQGRD